MIGVNEMNAPNGFRHSVGVGDMAFLNFPGFASIGGMNQRTVTSGRPTFFIVEHKKRIERGGGIAFLGCPALSTISGMQHGTGIT
jgi:hypothetical protein